MPCKCNVKSSFYTVIIVLAISSKLFRADEANSLDNQANQSSDLNSSKYIVNVLDTEDFYYHVLGHEGDVVALFTAPWCVPCKQISPNLELAVREQKGKIKLARVDVQPSELQILAYGQTVRSIPTVASYKKGKLVDTMEGVHTYSEVQQFIQEQVGGPFEKKRIARKKTTPHDCVPFC